MNNRPSTRLTAHHHPPLGWMTTTDDTYFASDHIHKCSGPHQSMHPYTYTCTKDRAMRDLVCARGGKLLLGFAGDALLLVDLARQVPFWGWVGGVHSLAVCYVSPPCHGSIPMI